MKTIWSSLIWKEWHEHKWKLAAIAAVICGATTVSLFAGDGDEFGLAFAMMLFCTIPLSIFVGLSSAASERSRSTMPYLQSLPAPTRQVTAVKLGWGLVTVVVPVLLACGILFFLRIAFDLLGVKYRSPDAIIGLQAGPFQTGSYFLDAAFIGAIIAASAYIWAAATGVNRKDEVSAGAVALSCIIGWSAAVILLLYNLGDLDRGLNALSAAGFSVIPGGVTMLLGQGAPVSFGLLVLGFGVAAAVHVALAAFYVIRFGRTTEREVTSPRVARKIARSDEWLRPPMKTPLQALVWKQLRESVPIVLAGLAVIVGTALVGYAMNTSEMTTFAEAYFQMTIVLGCVVALVAGIGVALQDVGPQLSTFWRSRPINPSLWFVAKCVTGLGVVLMAIYLPLFIIYVVRDVSPDWELLSVVPLLHTAVYAAAVSLTCIVRHAVYAAVLSIGLVVAMSATGALSWRLAKWAGWVSESYRSYEAVALFSIVAAFVFCILTCTILGWLAMKNDWGWKARY
jgi:hypothetical protein